MPDKPNMPFDRRKITDYVNANKRLLKLAAVLIAVMMVTAHVKGCLKDRLKHAVQPRPVQTALAEKKDVPVYIDSFGNLLALNSVDIVAQVTGQIQAVHFEEGDEVARGDLLFTIDPSEFKADLEKTEAAIAENIVTLKLKKDTFERNKKLFEKGLISQQDFEKYQTDVAAAEAEIKSNQANVDLARISLEYCYIKSPVDGIAGARQVDPGNIVTANSGPKLVNIKTIDPLSVDFPVPDRDLFKVREAMSGGTLKVEVSIEGDGDRAFTGELKFLSNAVDESTGTIALRASVPNEDKALWPGQFVKVRLILRTEEDAVVVPYQAVQIGRQGTYLFVATRGNKADLRIVKTGQRDGDHIVIEEGVKAGEKVVTAGQMGLSPGVPVVDITKQIEEQSKKK